jgi:hypothetical protein
MSQPSAMEIGEPTVFILDPKNLRRAGMVELLRSWAANVKVSLVDVPLVTSPHPADALECRLAIIRICSQVGRPPAAWSGYNVWDVRRGSTRWGSSSGDPMEDNHNTG